MDYAMLWASGMVTGLVVAAPVGPVNLICIRRSLEKGAVHGFIPGVGAAVGDGLFAFVAAFGITAVLDFVQAHAVWLQWVGGLVLVVMGVSSWLTRMDVQKGLPDRAFAGALPAMGITFFLTCSNPVTMMGFLAVFGGMAGFGAGPQDYGRASVLVGAVVAGSALWWAVLSIMVASFRTRMSDKVLTRVNRVSAGLIVLCGVGVLSRTVVGM